jgi:hypothetical protein
MSSAFLWIQLRRSIWAASWKLTAESCLYVIIKLMQQIAYKYAPASAHAAGAARAAAAPAA